MASENSEFLAELTKKSHLFQPFDNEFELVLFVLLKVAGNPFAMSYVVGFRLYRY